MQAARPHTFEAKHRILREYMRAWFPIFVRAEFAKKLTVLDAFAGPGRYADGHPGSPLILLEELLSRPDLVAAGKPVHFIFIENDPDDFAGLEQVLDERYASIPPHITIARQRGKCQDLAEAMLKESGAFGWGRPIFVNLDAEGFDVPFPLVRRIAANDASEVLVTMLTSRLVQFAAKPSKKADDQFGPVNWQDVVNEPSDEKARFLVMAYRETLRRAGFKAILTFSMVEDTGYALHLHFATNGARGFERMKDAFWKADPVQGVRFRDPRLSGQQSFAWTLEADLVELKAWLCSDLLADDGWHTVDQVKAFVWPTLYRPVHATTAVQELLRSGQLERRPKTGRLTGDIEVRLVPTLFTLG